MQNPTAHPPWQADTLAPLWPEKVVAICFYGRSGSYFLQSLLDSHPRLLTVFGNLYTYFHEFWEAYRHLERDKLILAFCQYYAFIFDGANRCPADTRGELDNMGKNEDQKVGVDPVQFLHALHGILDTVENLTRRRLFQAVHMAFHIALGRTPHPDPIIVYQLHNPRDERTTALLEDFPDTIFLHMIREPSQSLNSHMRIYIDRDDVDFDAVSYCWVLNGIVSGGKPIVKAYKERSRAVRLEDLKEDPRGIMERVRRWIGIEWHDCLLESTVYGRQFWFTSGEGKRLGGFEKEHLKKKRSKYFHWFDHFRLDLLLAAKRQFWGYPAPVWSKWEWLVRVMFWSVFVPMRMERTFSPGSQLGVQGDWWLVRQTLWRGWRERLYAQRGEIPLLEEQPQPGYLASWKMVADKVIRAIPLGEDEPARQEAERQLRMALRHFPREPGLYGRLSLILMAGKRDQEALELLDKGVRLAGETPEMLMERGFWRLRCNDLDGAEADLRRSLTKGERPLVASLVNLGGDVCLRRGQVAEGKGHLHTAVTMDVGHAQAWAFLLLAAHHTRDRITIVTARRQLKMLDANHPVLLWSNGQELA
ncbi:MAG: sulfotransferase [Magnetococcales bacterium]|nr:sulfotransferase [Magnetococcales bacterium]